MLALSGELGYIHEPFNIGGLGPKLPSLHYWFESVTADHPREARLRCELMDVLNWRWPLGASLKSRRGGHEVAELLVRYADFRCSGWRRKRPLLKDPIALYSAEWIEEVCNAQVLVCIRHPAAFCLSLRRKGWTFDFKHLAAQRVLRERLGPFWEDVEQFARHEQPLLEQAILLWNCTHHVIDAYRDSHADWLFVRNEDVSRDPVAALRTLYGQLNLEFSDAVARNIRASTQRKSPAWKKTVRDSRANIRKWRQQLSGSDVDTIRARTDNVARRFYSDADW